MVVDGKSGMVIRKVFSEGCESLIGFVAAQL